MNLRKFKRMDHVTAVRLLRFWLVRNDRSQAWLAEKLCVDQGTVSRWFKGTLRPGGELRDAIEALTGIATIEWLTNEERAKKARRDREVAAARREAA